VPGCKGARQAQLRGLALAELRREDGLLWGLLMLQFCHNLLVFAAVDDLPI